MGNTPVDPADSSPATTSGELPDWAKQKIADLNAEAAKYRVQKNDAVEAGKTEVRLEYEQKLAEAQSRYEQLVTDKSNADLALTRIDVALGIAGLPTSKVKQVASLLHGTTEAELRSHAEEVKSLLQISEPAPARAVDPSQGRGNQDVLPLNGDKLLEAVKRKIGAT